MRTRPFLLEMRVPNHPSNHGDFRLWLERHWFAFGYQLYKFLPCGYFLEKIVVDSIGGVLSFAQKLLREETTSMAQLFAGHFALQLLPKALPLPGPQGWKILGIDRLLELQISSAEWLNRRLQATGAFTPQSSHEH